MADFIYIFLREGVIFGLRLGDSKDFVVESLGDPDDVLENGGLKLYKYGSFEITFMNDRVCILSLELYENEVLLPEELYSHKVICDKNLESFTADLDASDIGWHICAEKSYDSFVALVTESEVVVYYELPYVGFSKFELSNFGEDLYKYT